MRIAHDALCGEAFDLSAQIDNAVDMPALLAALISPQLQVLAPIPLFVLSSMEARSSWRVSPSCHPADTELPDWGRKTLGKSARRHGS
jgi:hypothetical protein